MKLSQDQVRAAAAMIVALQALPDDERLDVLAFVAKCWIEPEPHRRIFEEATKTDG